MADALFAAMPTIPPAAMAGHRLRAGDPCPSRRLGRWL
jgi:hypothetical protein